MISDRLSLILNQQFNKELYSAYLYLSMSTYFFETGLLGFSNWMDVQAQEEQAHAMLIYNYMKSREVKIQFDKIDSPDGNFNNPLDVIETLLAHEIYITRMINHVVEIAQEEKDRATESYFGWFIDEQVEEESNVNALLTRLKLADTDKSALFLLDNQLSTRVFVPPVRSR